MNTINFRYHEEFGCHDIIPQIANKRTSIFIKGHHITINGKCFLRNDMVSYDADKERINVL